MYVGIYEVRINKKNGIVNGTVFVDPLRFVINGHYCICKISKFGPTTFRFKKLKCTDKSLHKTIGKIFM